METAPDEENSTLLQGSLQAETPDPSASDIKLSRVFSYTVNPDKTHIGADGDVDILVSGHHCNPDLAETDFKRCRGLYYMNGHKEHTGYAKAKRPLRAALGEDGKPVLDENGRMVYDEKAPVYKDPVTGKVVFQQYQKKKEARTAYMWMMSFPGKKELGYEPDPRLVHEIGRAFCREYLDDYACTISTHVNTEHCHNHIMQCAYSLDGTRKYRDTMEALAKARDISDQLSLRFGLPIILSPQTDRGVSWFEWKKKHDGHSWKQQMRTDIREAAGIADSTADFCRLMKAIGYTVRETENHFTFTMPGAGENGEGYRCRDSRLNSSDDNFDYSKTGIRNAIERRTGKQPEADRKPAAHSFDSKHRGDLRHYATHIYISRYTIDGRRRTALELLFIEALKIITLLRDLFQVKDAPGDHPVYFPYQKKLRLMEDSLAMVQKLGLEDRDALSDLLNQTGTTLSQLKKQHKNSQPVHAKEQEMFEKIEEARELIEVMKTYGIDISDLELHHYSKQEIRRARAALMPMTPAQRRELYLALSDSPLYRLRCKYEELTYQDAREVIAFLRSQNSNQPSVLFSLNERNGSGQRMSPKNTETEANRRSHDTFFLSRLADFPMDKQIRIDHCRELLNELALLGIAPDGMEDARNELRQAVASFDSIEHRMAEVSEEYRKLKRLEQNLALAANPRFTHGPLFDAKEEKPVEKTLVENVDQLRPEDRAEEEKRRYEIYR
ncbi:MAG: relaxase/mobilization nuclease domain-containing protein [Lachnospiraceae bacterium]|nr:relaxase/mobilization nuclease domain-containing protein [Lachnospiraceae bacterium]